MTRPDRLVVIAGTGTEIGKTWVACRILELARARRLRVAARKPAQSFAVDSNAQETGTVPIFRVLENGDCPRFQLGSEPTDAEQLANASGEAPYEVCPQHRWYPVAMAPPMAADVLGRERFALDDLIHEIRWTAHVDLGFVETAGGLRSPITHDADNIELIDKLAPDAVLLVANAGLGTINSVRLSLAALTQQRVSVFLNRFDPTNDLHVRNRRWLVDVYGCTTATEAGQWLDL
ncbi:MAG TPA: dethiobiotin synthase [Steroidobacteraceae bacterium]|nr:dethiobiotin synthase [Steroidobacteraceae bacterium]